MEPSQKGFQRKSKKDMESWREASEQTSKITFKRWSVFCEKMSLVIIVKPQLSQPTLSWSLKNFQCRPLGEVWRSQRSVFLLASAPQRGPSLSSHSWTSFSIARPHGSVSSFAHVSVSLPSPTVSVFSSGFNSHPTDEPSWRQPGAFYA